MVQLKGLLYRKLEAIEKKPKPAKTKPDHKSDIRVAPHLKSKSPREFETRIKNLLTVHQKRISGFYSDDDRKFDILTENLIELNKQIDLLSKQNEDIIRFLKKSKFSV